MKRSEAWAWWLVLSFFLVVVEMVAFGILIVVFAGHEAAVGTILVMLGFGMLAGSWRAFEERTS